MFAPSETDSSGTLHFFFFLPSFKLSGVIPAHLTETWGIRKCFFCSYCYSHSEHDPYLFVLIALQPQKMLRRLHGMQFFGPSLPRTTIRSCLAPRRQALTAVESPELQWRWVEAASLNCPYQNEVGLHWHSRVFFLFQCAFLLALGTARPRASRCTVQERKNRPVARHGGRTGSGGNSPKQKWMSAETGLPGPHQRKLVGGPSAGGGEMAEPGSGAGCGSGAGEAAQRWQMGTAASKKRYVPSSSRGVARSVGSGGGVGTAVLLTPATICSLPEHPSGLSPLSY